VFRAVGLAPVRVLHTRDYRYRQVEAPRLGRHLSIHGVLGRTILNTVPVVPEGPRIFEAMT
jgi:hypothetical protein